MKPLTHIIIHCSDSRWGSVDDIRAWHLQRGFKDVGYHFVILNGRINSDLELPSTNGSIEGGRPLDGDAFIEDNEIGAHALGYNDKSIGICLIGKDEFTVEQMEALKNLLRDLLKHYKINPKNVLGHRETEQGKHKTCPNFDVSSFRQYFSGRV